MNAQVAASAAAARNAPPPAPPAPGSKKFLRIVSNYDIEPVTMTGGGGTTYAVMSDGALFRLLPGGPLFSADGGLIVSPFTLSPDGNPVFSGDRMLWVLPGRGRTPEQHQVEPWMAHVLDKSRYWGLNPQTGDAIIQAPEGPETLRKMPVNLARTGGEHLHAFFGNRWVEAWKDGKWNMSQVLGDAADMATDGTAIRSNFQGNVLPILINGRWQTGTRTIPDLPGAWRDGTGALLDTTPGGWILAKRNTGEHGATNAALLPLRLEGDLEIDGKTLTESVGVDAFSIGSSNPGAAVAERIWIMAPSGGGETKVRLKAPVRPGCTLEITGEGLKFNGSNNSVEVQSEETLFTVRADNNIASGTEVPLVFKLKRAGQETASLSFPVAAKVMKRRTIRVHVWLIRADDGELPKFRPDKATLEKYLNDRYQPQINAVFDCHFQTRGPLNFNTTDVTELGMSAGQYIPRADYLETDAREEFGKGFKGEMDRIVPNNYIPDFNINLYLVGGVTYIVPTLWNAEKGEVEQFMAAGAADRDNRRCWVAAGFTNDVNDPEKLDTVAHEIGHIIFGHGHPDASTVRDILNRPIPGRLLTVEYTGPAPLPGTVMPKRLMCSGILRRKDGSSRMIVKGEWDKAVDWFKEEIEGNRMPE